MAECEVCGEDPKVRQAAIASLENKVAVLERWAEALKSIESRALAMASELEDKETALRVFLS